MAGDDVVRDDSEAAMTVKALVLEVYRDMKFVRPAVENLLAQGLDGRVENLEKDRLERASAKVERRRIGDLTNRGVVFVVVVAQAIFGAVVAISTILADHSH